MRARLTQSCGNAMRVLVSTMLNSARLLAVHLLLSLILLRPVVLAALLLGPAVGVSTAAQRHTLQYLYYHTVSLVSVYHTTVYSVNTYYILMHSLYIVSVAALCPCSVLLLRHLLMYMLLLLLTSVLHATLLPLFLH
jgi:hypothetical protein